MEDISAAAGKLLGCLVDKSVSQRSASNCQYKLTELSSAKWRVVIRRLISLEGYCSKTGQTCSCRSPGQCNGICCGRTKCSSFANRHLTAHIRGRKTSSSPMTRTLARHGHSREDTPKGFDMPAWQHSQMSQHLRKAVVAHVLADVQT